MITSRKTGVFFHHFKGAGTLCVFETEGESEALFGVALQHDLDKFFNRPLGRIISEGRAWAQKGKLCGRRSLEELKNVIKTMRSYEKLREYQDPGVMKDQLVYLLGVDREHV